MSGGGAAPELRRGPGRPGSGPPGRLSPLAGLLSAAGVVLLPAILSAQHTLHGPSGRSITYDSAAVREMLERTRRLRKILEEDPAVVYYVGKGEPATAEDPRAALPWRAVTVRSDSAVEVVTPGNLRESERAYYAYAVERMERIRAGRPTSSCETALRQEVELVSAFVDGWVVTRTLYGGPAFAPLDRFAFAREAGHLPALVVSLDDTAVSDRCLRWWREAHPEAMAAFRAWREATFRT